MKKTVIALLALIVMPVMAFAEEETTGNPKSFGKFGIYYKTVDFDSFKELGGYGIDMTMYMRCGEETSKGYLGVTVQILQFNFGLVNKDYTSDQIAFGLSPLYYVSKNFQLMCPVNVTVNTAFSNKMKELLGKSSIWGLDIIPQIRASIFDIGLVLHKSFESGSKMTTGIYLGLAF